MENLSKLFPISLFFILLMAFQASFAQSIVPIKTKLSAQLDSLVNSQYEAGRFSGAVLVADRGKLFLKKEYGHLNIDAQKPIQAESVFEIASLSKQFTALLIMMLKEEQKVDYEDKITKYFPKLPYKDITIRHLLSHTSGLSEKKFFAWARHNMDPKKIYTNEFILRYLEQERPALAFEAGTKWEYSNLGYFLLALIIEQTSGSHYIQFLQEKILKPLDMQHTGIFSQAIKGTEMNNYVFGKIFNPKDSVCMSSFGMAWSDSLYGGVGIVSNTSDLFKWDRALYGNALVKQETLQAAFEPYTLADGSSAGYGFGWYIQENFKLNGKNYGKRLEHNGLWPGYESIILRYIDADKTIIILSNQSPSSTKLLAEKISLLLFDVK